MEQKDRMEEHRNDVEVMADEELDPEPDPEPENPSLLELFRAFSKRPPLATARSASDSTSI